MTYLLLIIGLLIGAYALYRFFLNADVQQIKALFLLAIIVVLCAALFTLAVTGRLPLGIGFIRARQQADSETLEPGLNDEIKTREDALEVLGLEDHASEKEIKAAYKKLMQKVHPDHEGSEWMAAKLNQAKEILMDTQPDS